MSDSETDTVRETLGKHPYVFICPYVRRNRTNFVTSSILVLKNRYDKVKTETEQHRMTQVTVRR